MAGEQLDDKAVLDYLRAKRAALDQAIAALEGKVGDLPIILNGGGGRQEIQPDSFVGMNIATASVKYLQMVGRPARTTDQIHEALAKGGLPNFTRLSVATILQRMANRGGEVVRASKGLWGLPEWYPNRPRVVKKKSQEKGESEEPNAGKESKKEAKKSS